MNDKGSEHAQNLVNEQRTLSVQEIRRKYENTQAVQNQNRAKQEINSPKQVSPRVIPAENKVADNKETIKLERKIGDEPPKINRAHRSRSFSNLPDLKILEQREQELKKREEKVKLAEIALKEQFLKLEQEKLRLAEENKKIDKRIKEADIKTEIARHEQASSLIATIMGGSEEVMRERLKAIPDLNVQMVKTGDTPLHVAIKQQKFEMVQILLAGFYGKADPNITNKRNETALHVAAQIGNKEIIELLLNNEKWPNPKIKDIDGKLAADLLPTNLESAIKSELQGLFNKYTEKANQLYENTKMNINQEIDSLKLQKQRHAEQLSKDGNINNRDLLQNAGSIKTLIDSLINNVKDTVLLPDEKESLIKIIENYKTEVSQESDIKKIKERSLTILVKSPSNEQKTQNRSSSDEQNSNTKGHNDALKKQSRKDSLKSLTNLSFLKTWKSSKVKNEQKSEQLEDKVDSTNYGIKSKNS